MKTLITLLAITFGFILIYNFIDWTEKRDAELMKWCADPITQTLYECE